MAREDGRTEGQRDDRQIEVREREREQRGRANGLDPVLSSEGKGRRREKE